VTVGLAVAVVAGGCSVLLGHGSNTSSRGPKIGVVGEHTHSGPVHPNRRATPLEVVSISPAPGSQGVDFTSAITVRFSEPLAPNTAMPRLFPTVPGRWMGDGPEVLVFHPRGNYVPYTTENLLLSGGVQGLLGDNGGLLRKSETARFTIAAGSELRLQQLLAELGYLPVRFVASAPTESAARLTSDLKPTSAHRPTTGTTTTTTTTSATSSTTTTTTSPATTTTTTRPVTTTTKPSKPKPKPTTTTSTTTTTQVPVTTLPAPPPQVKAPPPEKTIVSEPTLASDIPLAPLSGRFTWRFRHTPASLAALWVAGQPNVITTAAVMQFEEAHGLATDGDAGTQVWAALLRAVAHRQVNTAPYGYVYVTTSYPETVNLWVDGSVIFTTPCNTGIPQAPTELGTWPVYARYVTTTMTGKNPNGSHYADPGIPWVSYFHGGDALHGFLRSQYGFPQSLGCVEMPYAAAGTVFPWTPIGTLVTIM